MSGSIIWMVGAVCTVIAVVAIVFGLRGRKEPRGFDVMPPDETRKGK